jgi:mono/diheme cytochrome c family protein
MGVSAQRISILCILFVGINIPSRSQSTSISYGTKCEVCHGRTGLAETSAAKRLGVLPFTDASIVAKSDSTLIGIIQNGSGKMPSFKDKLTDQELSNLIQFIRQTQKQ